MTTTDDDRVSLEVLADRQHDAWSEELHTMTSGRIERYTPGDQWADVKPMIRRVRRTASGERVTQEFPILRRVPIAHPRWGEYFIHAPLAAGDSVELRFATRDLAGWLRTGEIADPIDVRLHHLAHAVASPGLYPHTRKLDGDLLEDDALVVGHSGGARILVKGDDTVEIHAGTIKHGAAATHRAGDAEKILAELQAIAVTLASLTGGGGSPATFGTPYVAPSDALDVGASKVRVE